jgi:hypothetical protein
LPDTTSPDTGKVSAIIDGTAAAKIIAPSRIFRLAGYIIVPGPCRMPEPLRMKRTK